MKKFLIVLVFILSFSACGNNNKPLEKTGNFEKNIEKNHQEKIVEKVNKKQEKKLKEKIDKLKEKKDELKNPKKSNELNQSGLNTIIFLLSFSIITGIIFKQKV
jgi:hypothetical protein